MRLSRFTNGGYCIHKITGRWKGTVSAWYNRDGILLDAEQIFYPFGPPSRQVKKDWPMWKEIQIIGKRYQNIPTE